MQWPLFSVALAVALPTRTLGDIPRHFVANWRAKPSYVFSYEFIAPGDLGTAARMNSCSVPGVPAAMQCSGRGYCRSWSDKFVAGAPPRVSFCECNRGWADPECRTPRRSQTTAYLLSLFLGFLGVDQMYLGSAAFGIAKFFTFGGFGFWWLYDIVRIGSGPVYTGQQYRVAEDLERYVFVLSSVCLFLLLGFLLAFYSIVRNQHQKRKEALLLQEAEESAILRSLKEIDVDKNIIPGTARMVGQRIAAPVQQGWDTQALTASNGRPVEVQPPVLQVAPSRNGALTMSSATPAPPPRTVRSLSPAPLVSGAHTITNVQTIQSPRAAATASPPRAVRSLSPAPLVSGALTVPGVRAPVGPYVQTQAVPKAAAAVPARAPAISFAPAPARTPALPVRTTGSSVRRTPAVRSLSPVRSDGVRTTTQLRRQTSPTVVRAPKVASLARSFSPEPVATSGAVRTRTGSGGHSATIRKVTITEQPAILDEGGHLVPTAAPHTVKETEEDIFSDEEGLKSFQTHTAAPTTRGRSPARGDTAEPTRVPTIVPSSRAPGDTAEPGDRITRVPTIVPSSRAQGAGAGDRSAKVPI